MAKGAGSGGFGKVVQGIQAGPGKGILAVGAFGVAEFVALSAIRLVYEIVERSFSTRHDGEVVPVVLVDGRSRCGRSGEHGRLAVVNGCALLA